MGKPAYQTLIDFWAASKIDINFGLTPPAKIVKLEERYGIKLPSSFRNYLINTCPKGEYEEDGDYTTWWNFDEIKSVEENYKNSKYLKNNPILERDAGQYIIFVDYLIWSWSWAICCKPGDNYGRIMQLSRPPEFVCNSFDEFVQAYIKQYGDMFFLEKMD